MFIEKALLIGEDTHSLTSLQDYLSPYVRKTYIASTALKGIQLLKEQNFLLVF